MPKEKHSPITDEEAEEIVQRFVDNPEDIDKIYAGDEWQQFFRDKIYGFTGGEMTDAQLNVFGRGRSYLFGDLAAVGYKTTTHIIYGQERTVLRDALGRFASTKGIGKIVSSAILGRF